jgi:hypothetical protein
MMVGDGCNKHNNYDDGSADIMVMIYTYIVPSEFVLPHINSIVSSCYN